MRRHQLPPTDPPLSPEDSDGESPDELFEELSDADGAGAGSGSRARSGVDSGAESAGVESVVSLAPFDESFDPFDEDLREIGRRCRVGRVGFSSAASSDFVSVWSTAFSAVDVEDFEDDVDTMLKDLDIDTE